MSEPFLPVLSNRDTNALLFGLLRSNVRGVEYQEFLDRLEKCGLRFQRPGNPKFAAAQLRSEED